MNEEQIKEAMRLGELWAMRAWNGGKGDEDEITKIVPMRANLEAYLRTIGKPESVNAEMLEALKAARESVSDGLETTGSCELEWSIEDKKLMERIDAAIARAESAIETPAKVSPCADQQIIDYVKGVYAFLESTSPAGFADEAFRLPPLATRALQLFADAIQSDELGKRVGSEGQDCKNRERHESAVAMASPCAGHAAQQEADASRDWPEDFPHENGQYMNTCHVCKNTFIGHKRRAVCKVCNNGFIRAQQEADEGGA